MKVLVLTRLFPNRKEPLHGMFIRRRTVALAKLCEVKVLAPCTQPGVAEREQVGDVDVIRPRWRRLPKVGVLLDGRSYAAAARGAIEQHCAAFDFDVIDSHWLYPDGFAAVRLGRRLGKPVVVTGRGTDVNELCFRWPWRWPARRAIRGATRLVAVSRALKEKMVEAGGEPDRIAVIQNGVDTTLFHPAADRRAVRRALDMPREEILLFSAGGLAEAKGFQDLIAGLALLPPEPPLHLYIAGDGPYRKALKQLIRERQLKDRVTLLKTIPQTKMAPWYQAADFFCFGSWREGCPNAVLEALACGTPVVSTRVGAVPDLVAEERSGLLFEPGASGDRSSGAAEAFAATMKQALARTWDRAAIAARGSRRSWDHVAAEYCAVFEQAVASWEPVA